ncbi:pyridoxamine 5'-phosphate oxidase family protein [Litchfieldia alkalitelluris]|uniref:pyridoxamine 5'-phosphate oxidase family protein n=1 Tax=Litchfieldia alkalitelluris TaxID=304268 RepID=UPI0009981C5F|nr:pyridoxamine 5'-phosphate oxidase family protein [Litchfieldia alkalitelluris]
MANQVEERLTQPLFDYLQKERLVTISTIDHHSGGPNVNAISWIYALNHNEIIFAVNSRSKIIENIRNNANLVITIIYNESVYSISGKGFIQKEQLDKVPLKLAAVKFTIEEVRDIMFYGAQITILPKYEKTYDSLAAEKLDNQVMEAMKKA